MGQIRELRKLIRHLKLFDNLEGAEVPPWVRKSVKQYLGVNRPDLALQQLEGQLRIAITLSKSPGKDKLLEIMGLERRDLGSQDEK